MTANDQELASINRLAGNYAMVRSPSGVANRYTNLSEIGKGEDADGERFALRYIERHNEGIICNDATYPQTLKY